MDNLNNQNNDTSNNNQEQYGEDSYCWFRINKEYLYNYIITIEEMIEKMNRFEDSDGDKYLRMLHAANDRILRFAKCYVMYFSYKQKKFKHSHMKKLIHILKVFQILTSPKATNYNIPNMLRGVMGFLEEK